MDPDSTPRGSSLCHGYSWYPMSGFSTPEKHQKTSCFRKFAAGNNSDPYALKSLGLEGNLHPSPIFIDVGANLGLVSISLAKQWPFARILALEPAPATFRYLLWNLKENQVDIPGATWMGFGDPGGCGEVVAVETCACSCNVGRPLWFLKRLVPWEEANMLLQEVSHIGFASPIWA